jgi:hypothetical protein
MHEHREELAAKSAAARERVRQKFSVEAMTDRWLAEFPQTPGPASEWPTDWNIKPPLTAHPVVYSPALRFLRRLAKKFQGRLLAKP